MVYGPLLDNGSINKGFCQVIAATDMHETIKTLLGDVFYAVRAEML
jgi:hypothetical protein